MRTPDWIDAADSWRRAIVGRLSNVHNPGDRPDIFIFATPRSGSTFLLELLFAQPGTKLFDEPLTVNYRASRRELGAATWEDLALLPDRNARYSRFFDRLRSNRIKRLNVPAYRRYGRLLTSRNVFKIIHGAEGMIPWFAETFGGKTVILLRHPIPTALSHLQLPRLPFFLRQPELRALLSAPEVGFAEQLIAEGDGFDCGILNWALQIVGMLRPGVAPDWAVISYEDLTVFPQQSFDFLQKKLDLDPVANIEELAGRPSQSTYKQTINADFLRAASGVGDRSYLIRRWTDRVAEQQVQRCFDICRRFGLDVYEEGNLFPSAAYRIPGLPQCPQEKTAANGMIAA